MVFFQHYCSLPWGWTGVNIFFVLSGFLITGILFDTRDDLHRARNFYVRRTLRIFPLYYGIFFGLLLVSPFFHWRWSIAWIAWPLYLANFLRFLSPSSMVWHSPLQLAGDAWLISAGNSHTVMLYLGHFWSLCVEEQFYLFWPWVVFWLGSRRALLWICGTAVVVVPLLRVVAQHAAPPWMLQGELLYRATPFQLDSLLLGGLIALLWRGAYRERLITLGRIVGALSAVVAIAYLAFSLHASVMDKRGSYLYPSWDFTWGLSFVNIFTAAVILCCLRSTGSLAAFLSLRPLRSLGRISYGAYVFHDILHPVYSGVIAKLGHRVTFIAKNANGCTALLGLSCTLIISWLSFRFFESRFLDLKERWTIRA